MFATTEPTLEQIEQAFLNDLRERMDALRPAAEEFRSIEARLSHWDGGSQKSTSGSSTPRSGRSSNRLHEFLQIVQDNPGIKARDISQKMGMKGPNYVYRLRGAALAEGKLRVEDGGFYPVEESDTPDPARVAQLDAARSA